MGHIIMAMHIKEVQKALDKACKDGTPVSIRALKRNGEWADYNGWVVHGGHWRRGVHRLRNPVNGEIRAIPDICIKYFNGHKMYL